MVAAFFLDCTFCVVLSHMDCLSCHIGVEMSICRMSTAIVLLIRAS